MYINSRFQSIADDAPYISIIDETWYPGNYPKSEIPELYLVKEVAAPEDKVILGFTIDSDYNQVWNVRDKTPEEIAQENIDALNSLRVRRNQLLAKCDWIDLPHTPLSSEQLNQFLAYRQTLRDLPEVYANNAAEVIWPILPK